MTEIYFDKFAYMQTLLDNMRAFQNHGEKALYDRTMKELVDCLTNPNNWYARMHKYPVEKCEGYVATYHFKGYDDNQIQNIVSRSMCGEFNL